MTTDTEAEEKSSLLDWIKTIASAGAVYLAFTTVAFANYSIPSESMVPHLEVNDRVAVSKYAYGYSRYSLPLNLGALLPASAHRLFEHLPRRGDVVVFIHPITGRTMIKRAIGLPGDVIEMRHGRLWLNGEEVAASTPTLVRRQAHEGSFETAQRYEETLPDGYVHAVHDLTPRGALDDFGPYRVPEGHLFFMGDNRDNSLDSRAAMGAVPVENLIGRAEIVYFVMPGCDHRGDCPMSRWLQPLHH